MDQADRSGQLRRRGLMAGVAALVTGALSRAAPAEATHGGGNDPTALHVGQINVTGTNGSANQGTFLRRGAGSYPHTYVFYADASTGNGQTAIVGRSSPARTGVLGLAQWTGDNFPTEAAGVCGVGGSAEPGVLGLYGTFDPPGGYYAGVLGVSTAGVHAVQGVADSPGPVPPLGTVGVGGTSSAGYGVSGTSSSNVGVRGQSTSSYGVFGVSTNSTGVGGSSPSYIGVYGQTNGGVGVWGSASTGYALYGVSTSGIGIYGSSGNYIGVSASSGTSTGLYASSNSGLAAYFQSPVQVQGNFTVLPGFAKSVAVPHPDGSTRRMYCVESPESYFEDFGDGRLATGRASVQLDRDFAAVVHSQDYRVFLTPEGDCKGLYVSSKSPSSFEVRELQGGTSSLSFSYRVVARRKDIAGPRLERVDTSVRPERPARPRVQEPSAPPPPSSLLEPARPTSPDPRR